jgi:hypothetical protein
MSAPLIELGDCEWFAMDSAGQIGFFTSAGTRFVPEYYWPLPNSLLDMAEKVRRMPIICGHEFVAERQAGGRYESWTDVADRGLYGYDYDLYEDTGYKLVTVPNRPVRIGDVSASWARGIPVFPGVFGRNSMIIPSSPILQWKPVLLGEQTGRCPDSGKGDTHNRC